jgi:CheY-like chemotaxis protein
MPRILVVDDDPDILDIVRLELEDQPGNAVDTVLSAEKALIGVRDKQYDVIISDLRMPGMDGTTLIRNLRKQGCQAVLVIYSARGMGSEIQEALDAGANHYLPRSGDPESEFAALHRIIREKSEK